MGIPIPSVDPGLVPNVLEATRFGFRDLDRHYEDHGQWYGWSKDQYHQAASDFILTGLAGLPNMQLHRRENGDLLVRDDQFFAVLHPDNTIGTFFAPEDQDEDIDDFWERQTRGR